MVCQSPWLELGAAMGLMADWSNLGRVLLHHDLRYAAHHSLRWGLHWA